MEPTDTGIVIVDYGMGNLRSVEKAFARIGHPAKLSSDPADVESARAIVLPGVGAFRAACAELDARGLRAPLIERVRAGVPYLGICLGLQLLYDSSAEEGLTPGLGLLSGTNVRFPRTVKCPHMGWNQLKLWMDSPLTEGIPDNAYFYFVHSFHPLPDDDEATLGTCDYAGAFCAAIALDNIFAVQFHPEKSQEKGLRLLTNFARYAESQ